MHGPRVRGIYASRPHGGTLNPDPCGFRRHGSYGFTETHILQRYFSLRCYMVELNTCTFCRITSYRILSIVSGKVH